MKRYLLSAVLAVFAVGAIGSYYLFAAKGGMPEYQLKRVEGDASIGETFELGGSYVGGIGSKALTLSEAEGTKYRLEKGYFEGIKESHYFTNASADMQRLKKEHRSFMRSKVNLNSLYEDEEYLLYADVRLYLEQSKWNTVLKYERLELATGRTVKVSRTIETDIHADWIVVGDVQRIGREVHLLLERRFHDRNERGNRIGSVNEYVDLVVELDTGMPIREIRLDAVTDAEGSVETSMRTIANERYAAPSEYAVLRTHSVKYENDPQASPLDKESNASETVDDRLVAYSYRTGETKEIPAPFGDGGTLGGIDLALLNGSTLTIARSNEQSIETASFDLANGNESNGILAVRAEQVGGKSIHSYRLANGRIYALVAEESRSRNDATNHPNENRFVVVLDAASGKLLYKGRPEYAGDASDAERQMKWLWLNNVYVR